MALRPITIDSLGYQRASNNARKMHASSVKRGKTPPFKSQKLFWLCLWLARNLAWDINVNVYAYWCKTPDIAFRYFKPEWYSKKPRYMVYLLKSETFRLCFVTLVCDVCISFSSLGMFKKWRQRKRKIELENERVRRARAILTRNYKARVLQAWRVVNQEQQIILPMVARRERKEMTRWAWVSLKRRFPAPACNSISVALFLFCGLIRSEYLLRL